MGDQRPGEPGELAGDGIERGGLGEALGLFACVALGEGSVRGVPSRAERGKIEQATQLGIAICTEAELAVALARLVDSDVEAHVGHELIGVSEALLG